MIASRFRHFSLLLPLAEVKSSAPHKGTSNVSAVKRGAVVFRQNNLKSHLLRAFKSNKMTLPDTQTTVHVTPPHFSNMIASLTRHHVHNRPTTPAYRLVKVPVNYWWHVHCGNSIGNYQLLLSVFCIPNHMCADYSCSQPPRKLHLECYCYRRLQNK